jgi:hypothetical protein
MLDLPRNDRTKEDLLITYYMCFEADVAITPAPSPRCGIFTHWFLFN